MIIYIIGHVFIDSDYFCFRGTFDIKFLFWCTSVYDSPTRRRGWMWQGELFSLRWFLIKLVYIGKIPLFRNLVMTVVWFVIHSNFVTSLWKLTAFSSDNLCYFVPTFSINFLFAAFTTSSLDPVCYDFFEVSRKRMNFTEVDHHVNFSIQSCIQCVSAYHIPFEIPTILPSPAPSPQVRVENKLAETNTTASLSVHDEL